VESLEVTKEFWAGKRVFITGHTGFKGSWLTLWLQNLGASVTGFSLAPETSPNHFTELAFDNRLTSHIGDIRDLEVLRRALVESQAEFVFHLAAQPLVRESYSNPIETYDVNVLGTAKVLEAVRSASTVRSVVVITTDKVYENREWAWGYREIDRLGGYDPYSNSKACAELVTASFTQSFFNTADYENHGVAIATARAGNVFGGGDWAADRLIPDLIRAYQAGTAPVIRYPGSVRPWQHVLEPLRGYLFLGRALFEGGTTYAGAYNFGPTESDARPVGEICEIVSSTLEGSHHWEIETSAQPHEAGYLKLDFSKAAHELGWFPRTTLTTGLHMATRLYQGFLAGEAARDLSLTDIAKFESL
jgi:CDP-glucose 4,6-dehydratase